MTGGKKIKKLTVGPVFAWIFSIFFLMGALGVFATHNSSVLGGLALLAVGLLLLPPLSRWLKEKKHIEVSTGMKIIVAIVALVIFGLSTDDASSGTSASSTQTEAEVEAPVEKGPTMYGPNEAVAVDYLTYKVTNAEAFTKMGTSIMQQETKGYFVKVYLEITNNAAESQYIYTPRFKLIDIKSDKTIRSFDRFASDSLYIEDGLEFGKQLQPGLGVDGAIVFEVPKDVRGLVLQINGDWKSAQEIYIALPNVTNIGTDTTKQEAMDKQMDELMADSQTKADKMMEQYR